MLSVLCKYSRVYYIVHDYFTETMNRIDMMIKQYQCYSLLLLTIVYGTFHLKNQQRRISIILVS